MSNATELLGRALAELTRVNHVTDKRQSLVEEIRAYLDVYSEPDDDNAIPYESLLAYCTDVSKANDALTAQLKTYTNQEAEPVAWVPEDELSESYPYDLMFQYSKVDIIRWFPVYGPPTKTAPMTQEEIDSKFALDGSMFSSYVAFKQGIRFAEKHHGIGGSDE